MAFNINIIDQSSVDAFGRGRVSQPVTLFDSKQLFDGRSLFWSTSTATGGTVTWNNFKSSSTLAVTSSVGSQAIRQTKPRFNYATGKSMQIMTSFVMGANVAGITKRIGYFDGYNGLFLENDGTTVKFVNRTNVTGTPTDTAIAQTNWNIDKLNGTGPSGLTLDITKAQILFIDFEWLGVGRVRLGFVINGKTVYAHQFLNANSISSVYMSSPNLPVRSEVTNISAVAGSSMDQICTSVVAEGGVQLGGLLVSADRGVTPLTSVTNANLFPVISLRLNNAKAGTSLTPTSVNVFCTTSNANFKWALILNPTVAGVDSASWVSVTGVSAQYDVSRTTTNTLSGGLVIASGYGTAGATISADFSTISSLGLDLNDVSDQLVLAVQNVGVGTDSFVGSIAWREFE